MILTERKDSFVRESARVWLVNNIIRFGLLTQADRRVGHLSESHISTRFYRISLIAILVTQNVQTRFFR